jgi:hypothetical protein
MLRNLRKNNFTTVAKEYFRSTMPNESKDAFNAYRYYSSVARFLDIEEAWKKFCKSIKRRKNNAAKPLNDWIRWSDAFKWEDRVDYFLYKLSQRWDSRLEEIGETSNAFNAFSTYCSLEGKRRMSRAYFSFENQDCSPEDIPLRPQIEVPNMWNNWSSHYMWRERAASYDACLQQQRVADRMKRINRMNKQSFELSQKILKVVHTMVDDAINYPPEKFDSKAICGLSDLAFKLYEKSLNAGTQKASSITDALYLVAQEGILGEEEQAYYAEIIESLPDQFRSYQDDEGDELDEA